MASSNRHWPSMFKSKPCNTHHHHHQWQHDINPSSLMSSPCQRSSSSGGGGGGGEERSPEPKPRWNPKPEQIRILEAIFNSGMVNPPRDEIRKIRAQLQEYGQVGDANVFYWFQNRKSRSKHKQKHHHQHKTQQLAVSSSLDNITKTTASHVTPTLPLHQTSSSSSSSSSDSKTSPKGTTHHHENMNITSPSPSLTTSSLMGSLISSMGSGGSGNSFVNVTHDVSNSPLQQTSSSSHHADFLSSSPSSTSHLHEFFFPTTTSSVQNNFAMFPHHELGFSAPTDPSSLDVLHHDHDNHQVISMSGPCHGLLLSELLMMNNHHQSGSKRVDRQDHHQLLMMNYSSIDANTCNATTTNGHSASLLSPTPTATTTTTHARFDVNPIQGVALMGAPADAPRLTVFINDVAFEVSVGPFNMRQAFGDDALLIHSSGQPVLTNEWGVTLQSLQPGASYYLVI
ncbi:hypothetical protein Sjap_000387 [Stephania japonica]|uniref:Homeobox domain-containing protein n=1 Tax=Stephania japonica TaxID=461633 RepID=A0AAP0KHY8_9MAGN